MRRALFSVFLVLFSAGIVSAQPGDNYATWDFGRIRASDGAVKHVFPLKNDSAAELNIEGTNASCGCTVSQVDRDVIRPGDTANLEVVFDPKGYSGKVIQYVYVNTDSKDTPVYRFMIDAEVAKD
jgi:hypothetical protein